MTEADIHERIDDAIDRWHEGSSGIPLREHLGMTSDQYAAFVERCEVPEGYTVPDRPITEDAS